MHTSLLVGILFAAPFAMADGPVRVTYSGTLYSGAALFDGTIAIRMTLHSDPKTDSPEWSDDFEGVQVVKGRFTVALGSGKALDAAALTGTRYLAADVRRQGVDTGYVALGNRQRLVDVPYSRGPVAVDVIPGTLRVKTTATFGGAVVVEKDLHVKQATKLPFVLHETVKAAAGATVTVKVIPAERGFCALRSVYAMNDGEICRLVVEGDTWKLTTSGAKPKNECVAQCVTW